MVERKGIEPSTFALRTRRTTDASSEIKQLAANRSRRCTIGCTSNTKIEHETTAEGAGDQAADHAETLAEPAADQGADSLAVLAAALVNLSSSDRAKLAAMLLQGNDSKGPAPATKIGKTKVQLKPKAVGKAKRTTK